MVDIVGADEWSLDSLLISTLTSLIEENKTVSSLCRVLYDFRRTACARKLFKHARHDQTGLWNLVCHFIGRLGAWRKAALLVCNHASDFKDVLRNHRIKAVPIRSSEPHSPSQPAPTLEDLLLHTLPSSVRISTERFCALFGPDSYATGTAKLEECRKKLWKLKVHAEASVARFFLEEGLPFANTERYIGCSKPSCMCCALYLDCLPGNLERRPCHGNAWTQWRLPRGALPVDEKHISILEHMTSRMQSDIAIEIFSASKGHVHTHDSSTDVSSIFAQLSV